MSGAGTFELGSSRTPVPDLTILELGITIVCTRQPRSAHQHIADDIARWFHNDIAAADIELPLQRLMARGDMAQDQGSFCTTEVGRLRAEGAARALVRLIFRDRYFFDVGRLLDVTLVKEDGNRAK